MRSIGPACRLHTPSRLYEGAISLSSETMDWDTNFMQIYTCRIPLYNTDCTHGHLRRWELSFFHSLHQSKFEFERSPPVEIFRIHSGATVQFKTSAHVTFIENKTELYKRVNIRGAFQKRSCRHSLAPPEEIVWRTSAQTRQKLERVTIGVGDVDRPRKNRYITYSTIRMESGRGMAEAEIPIPI